MAKDNINDKKGFTIIEVVLVLAIAGLIFLMVFVALPALQRSQRDTARRNDMSRVDTSLVQYQTNNQSNPDGDLPVAGTWVATANFDGENACSEDDSACKFIRDYMNSGVSGANKVNEFKDQDGSYYSLVITDNYSDGALSTTSIGENNNSKLVVKDSGYTIGGDSPFSEHIVYIVPGSKCNGEIVVEDTARHFSILYRLEGAGVYCIDDQ